ncbi:hypothetical protein KM043_011757 [Ampulex compressa]|nr:hypothetical protein KM043_011757 [Ampulex compressa]
MQNSNRPEESVTGAASLPKILPPPARVTYDAILAGIVRKPATSLMYEIEAGRVAATVIVTMSSLRVCGCMWAYVYLLPSILVASLDAVSLLLRRNVRPPLDPRPPCPFGI